MTCLFWNLQSFVYLSRKCDLHDRQVHCIRTDLVDVLGFQDLQSKSISLFRQSLFRSVHTNSLILNRFPSPVQDSETKVSALSRVWESSTGLVELTYHTSCTLLFSKSDKKLDIMQPWIICILISRMHCRCGHDIWKIWTLDLAREQSRSKGC